MRKPSEPLRDFTYRLLNKKMHDFITTERLLLRSFEEQDVNDLFLILSDKEVNTFLPMFPFADIEEAKSYLQSKYMENYAQRKGFYYAVCLKEDNIPIGYIHVSGDDCHDLGYGLRTEFWHRGIIFEACSAVIDKLKQTDIRYITAAHDINNPRSGKVMQAIGMKYQYSYEEQWQPKNILVTFRMYQLNFDEKDEWVYKKYWDKYPVHFIESF